MSDDQLQTRSTIDDAIREAEEQLERRIEELRTVGDRPTASVGEWQDAVLRPLDTGEHTGTTFPPQDDDTESDREPRTLPHDLIDHVRDEQHTDSWMVAEPVSTPVQRMASVPATPTEHGAPLISGADFSDVERSLRERLTRMERSFQDEFSRLQDVVTTRMSGRMGDESFGRLGNAIDHQRELGHRTNELLNDVIAGMDRNRLQQTQDLEVLIDALTSGWQAFYATIDGLFARIDTFGERLASVEHRFDVMDQLERNVSTGLEAMREQLETQLSAVNKHMAELAPAPITVTVSHPEASVHQQTRPGYTAPASVEKEKRGERRTS